MARDLWLTGDPAADRLLAEDPFALLVGMLLDQQIQMEIAFAGPRKLADRMGGLDPRRIADADPEEFAALASQRPAIHRFARSMAARVQTLARAIVDEYGGDATRIWTDPAPDGGRPDGRTVLHRLIALPGYGERKASIFLALLGKQYDVQPPGWRDAAGTFGVAGSHDSIADVTDQESLALVRATKRAAKAAAARADTGRQAG